MKRSVEEIRRKRLTRTAAFLVTGGTGFIGSHMAVALLQGGFRVFVLCRPRHGLSGEQRVARLLRWFGMDPRTVSSLQVIEGFMDQPRFGLRDEVFSFLSRGIDEIFHCAADTSFAAKEKDRVEAVNVHALQNLLDFAVESGCYFFHHMSTAYVAGKRRGECPEELLTPNGFHNAYERTKHRGEWLVHDACRHSGMRYHIYRPAIVFGDSRTGRSLRFNALYYPVKMSLLLKRMFDRDIQEKGGQKARQMGVCREGDKLVLGLRVEKSIQGRINLIPIDFLVEAAMALMAESLENGVYHLVSPNPKTLDDLIAYTEDLFHLKGARAVYREDFRETPRSALEILFESYLETYHPYLQDRRRFSDEKTAPVLRKRGITCPELDFEVFTRIMNYAVRVDWGRRLFQDPA